MKNRLTVALIGNPNSGKSCIFNYLTKSQERVGNWGGVTVQKKSALLKIDEYEFEIIDLPGLYSLSTVSPDEELTRDLVIYGDENNRRPDIIIQVIDGCQLERSLYLTLQLIDQDIPLIIALNMFDEVRKCRINIDVKALSDRLGIPIVPTIGNRGEGVQELITQLKKTASYENSKPLSYKFDKATEKVINSIQEIWVNAGITLTRGRIIGLLTNAPASEKGLPSDLITLSHKIAEINKPSIGENWIDAITHTRYKTISNILAQCVQPSISRNDRFTSKVDSVLLHRIWGIPFFLLLMFILFQLTFTLGVIPVRWFDMGVSFLANLLRENIPGFIGRLIGDGIVGGVGMMLTFVPTILILLLGIYFIEDTGYMARAAFLMDRLMRLIGLHGKAFIPLIIGFGCNVPALLACRTIGNPKDRLLTMLLIPFMSCSARLPIYVMITAAFFPKFGGFIIIGLYLLGILIAFILGKTLKQTVLKGPSAPFVLELPVYRFPSVSNVLRQIGLIAAIFVKRIATFVVLFALFIWFLSNFPNSNTSQGSIDTPEVSPPSQIMKSQIQHRETYIYYLGNVIEPIMRPLGFTLEMDISLLSGFIAKEAVVVTLGVLLTGSTDTDRSSLIEQIRKNIPSPAVALAFLVFVLLYIPCLTTTVTLQYESRKWQWVLFSVGYQMLIEYILAFFTYRLSLIFGLG